MSPKTLLSDKGASLPKVIRLIRILDRLVPTDAPTSITQVTSLRGFRGTRIKGTTAGVSWDVTLFGGNFYLVNIANTESVALSMPLHVVNHLNAHLRRQIGARSRDLNL